MQWITSHRQKKTSFQDSVLVKSSVAVSKIPKLAKASQICWMCVLALCCFVYQAGDGNHVKSGFVTSCWLRGNTSYTNRLINVIGILLFKLLSSVWDVKSLFSEWLWWKCQNYHFCAFFLVSKEFPDMKWKWILTLALILLLILFICLFLLYGVFSELCIQMKKRSWPAVS